MIKCGNSVIRMSETVLRIEKLNYTTTLSEYE